MGRVLPGITMAALWVVFLLASPTYLFYLFILIVGFRGLYEYYRMTCTFLPHSKQFLSVSISLLPILASGFGSLDAVSAGLFASLLGSIFFVFRLYTRVNDVLGFLALNCLGGLYISFCTAHLVLIRFLPHGNFWLLMLTAITACSDTGAYYAGRKFGHRKLCPNISPNKTVAGAVGGVCAGVFGAYVIGSTFLPEVSYINICLMGLVLASIGIVGDLTESIAKRSSGVKDSGTLLAGHGGLLDRIDSLLLTGPALFYILWFNIKI
jgi:phosphatidate cytidylyltransferase